MEWRLSPLGRRQERYDTGIKDTKRERQDRCVNDTRVCLVMIDIKRLEAKYCT